MCFVCFDMYIGTMGHGMWLVLFGDAKHNQMAALSLNVAPIEKRDGI